MDPLTPATVCVRFRATVQVRGSGLYNPGEVAEFSWGLATSLVARHVAEMIPAHDTDHPAMVALPAPPVDKMVRAAPYEKRRRP